MNYTNNSIVIHYIYLIEKVIWKTGFKLQNVYNVTIQKKIHLDENSAFTFSIMSRHVQSRSVFDVP